MNESRFAVKKTKKADRRLLIGDEAGSGVPEPSNTQESQLGSSYGSVTSNLGKMTKSLMIDDVEFEIGSGWLPETLQDIYKTFP